MGIPILILGTSGSGKSASMRNFNKDELTIINVNGKMLPFKNELKSIAEDDYTKIGSLLKSADTKTIVIDDCQYLMANEFMRRAKETGFQKFTDIGEHFWSLVKSVEKLPADKIVYFLGHTERADDGTEKVKTIGKLLDEKITVEGMFTVVLKTYCKDGAYGFTTQTNGMDTVKSPMGMFKDLLISNDLKFVDMTIRDYYSFEKAECCTDCGVVITPANNRTIEQIINGTKTNYGRQLCMQCVAKIVQKFKK